MKSTIDTEPVTAQISPSRSWQFFVVQTEISFIDNWTLGVNDLKGDFAIVIAAMRKHRVQLSVMRQYAHNGTALAAYRQGYFPSLPFVEKRGHLILYG